MKPPNHVGTFVSPWLSRKCVSRLGDREGRPYIYAPQYHYISCRDTPCGCPARGYPDVFAPRSLNTLFPITYTSEGTTCQTTAI